MNTQTVELKENEIPGLDVENNSTGCCPPFRPDEWDDRRVRFQNKLFAKVKTRSIWHIPINIGRVFAKTIKAIEAAGAMDQSQCVVLSRDCSPWTSEHLFAVATEVPGLELLRMSGNFKTKVFEGPFSDIPKWCGELKKIAADENDSRTSYFYYTTCPKCAKVYGKNYVVGFVATGNVECETLSLS